MVSEFSDEDGAILFPAPTEHCERIKIVLEGIEEPVIGWLLPYGEEVVIVTLFGLYTTEEFLLRPDITEEIIKEVDDEGKITLNSAVKGIGGGMEFEIRNVLSHVFTWRENLLGEDSWTMPKQPEFVCFYGEEDL